MPSTVVGSAIHAPLAPSVNEAFAAQNYAVWRPFRYTTMEHEMSVYPSIAREFGTVFNLFLPAGRVVWSAQSGNYKDACSVMDATVSGMKYRACSVSEGTGYGMLISYFQNDLDVFTRLWSYSRSLRDYNVSALTPGLTYSFHNNIPDESSVTEADLDIATSLILMYYKTMDSDYLNDALTIVNGIWKEEVNKTNFLLYPGNASMWTGSEVYNLGYFSPVALRLFALVDPDPTHNWNAVLDAMYALMASAQAAGTGVFPDWSNAAGIAVNPPNQSAGNPDSPILSTNFSLNLAIGAGISNGSVLLQWYAAWCATGIGTNDVWLDRCPMGLNMKAPSNAEGSYYGDILLMMYSQLLNGMYVKPATLCSPPLSACKAINVFRGNPAVLGTAGIFL